MTLEIKENCNIYQEDKLDYKLLLTDDDRYNNLYYYFIEKEYSITQLTKIFKCHRSTIERWLKKYKIIANMRRNYQLYRNKDLLYDLYITQNLTKTQICNKLNVTMITLTNWLNLFEIKKEKYVKPKRIPKIFNYFNDIENNEFKELIYGHLLGDGGIIKTSNMAITFFISSKHRSYIEYIQKEFKKYNFYFRKIYKHIKDEKYTYYSTQSMAYRGTVVNLRTSWYGNNKTHLIPRDLKITPVLLRTFYIDDGYINYNKGYLHGIALSTENFQYNDLIFLSTLIKTELNLNSIAIYKKENGFIIRINKLEDIRKFFNYIGECPSELKDIFNYKWPKNNEIGRRIKY